MASFSYIEKYVSASGVEPWATANSPTTPASFDDMLLNLAQGERANIIGNVTRTTEDTFTNNGAYTSPMAIRGVDSSGNPYSGDRTDDHKKLADAENFPLITNTNASHALVGAAHMEISELAFTHSGDSAFVINLGTNDYGTIRNCKLTTTGTQARILSLAGDYAKAYNCDIYFSGTSMANAVVPLASSEIAYCRLENTTSVNIDNSGFLNLGNVSSVIGCQIICGSGNDYAVVFGGTTATTSNCSIYNAAFPFRAGGTGCYLATDCVAWGDNSAGSKFFDNVGVASRTITLTRNAYGNFDTANDTSIHQSENVALTANPFTDALNGDLSLNSDPVGGELCKQAGSFGNDIGAIQTPSAPSTSGALQFPVPMSGGLQ